LLGEINDEASSKEVDLVASTLDDASTNVADDEKDQKNTISSSIPSLDGAVQTVEEEAGISSEILKAPSAENETPGAPGPCLFFLFTFFFFFFLFKVLVFWEC
jgi:hypothetical protein